MADISTEIEDFRNAVYGEEVRGSMISLAEKLNDVCEDNEDLVTEHNTAIATAISNAETATTAANTAATASDTSRTAIESAESARASAESARASAETARATAETARSTAETARASSESARVTAEQGRVAAELARVTAETARTRAESARVTAEADRATAEATRVSNEATRVGSETVRVSNEADRQANETVRINNETERQRVFNTMSQQVVPAATTSTLGGIIVGNGLTVASDGTTSVTGAGDLETMTHAAATYATITALDSKANASHTHSASDVTSGTLAIAQGGTAAATAADALTNLGAAAASHTHEQADISDMPISLANGGTGATTAADARTALDAAQANGATTTLYDAEQAIAQNASDISDLQDSVVKTHEFTVTLSTSLHGSFYYADYDYASVTSKPRIIAAIATNSTGNRAAFLAVLTSPVIRVYGDHPGGSVTCRIVYV